MSCKHGNWEPCELCEAEDAQYDLGAASKAREIAALSDRITALEAQLAEAQRSPERWRRARRAIVQAAYAAGQRDEREATLRICASNYPNEAVDAIRARGNSHELVGEKA